MGRARGIASLVFKSHCGALGLMMLLALGLRFFKLGDKPFWSAELQEIFNARCAEFLSNVRDSGSDLAGFIWHNIVWRLDLVPLELFDRFPCALLGTLAVLVAWLWGWETLGKRGALAAALASAASVYLVDLSQTARWYIVAAVAGNAATILLVRLFTLFSITSGPRDRSAGDSRVRYPKGNLAPYWLCSAVALLSHGVALLFLPVHAFLFFLWLVFHNGRVSLKHATGRFLVVFLPVLPFAGLQLWLTLLFRPKMLNHEAVFGVGQGYNLWSVLKGVLLALSGGWVPFYIVFLLVCLTGIWWLFHTQLRAAVVVLACLLFPLAALVGLVGMAGSNAFDLTFASFLFAPAFVCFAAGLEAVLAFFSNRRAVASTFYAVLLALLLIPNAGMLARYYASPVKPVLGADFRSAALLLQRIEPRPEDYLFYRYDEYFTHLAFYAAPVLQRVKLVAEQVPKFSSSVLMEYLHRLNGCADRPRIAPEAVSSLDDMSGSRELLQGRAIVVLSCPPVFPAVESGMSTAESIGVPDYAAWILSAGRSISTCEALSRKLSSYIVSLYPGVLVAWKDVAGRTAAEVYNEMSRLFNSLPPSGLRLNPLPGRSPN